MTASADDQPSALDAARILLVEDNPVNQKVAKRMIAHMGHHVDVVDDGQQAVDAVENSPYDLVFMDVQMPVMDGIEATRTIRRLKGTSGKVPIIAMTAKALIGDREDCLEAGMDDYLSKPVRQGLLQEKLETWLKTKSPATEAQPATNASGPVENASTHEQSEIFEGVPLYDPFLKGELIDLTGEESFAELKDLLLQTTTRQVAGIHEAISAGDVQTASAIAHNIKGATGNLGLVALSRRAATLEKQLRNGDLPPIDAEVSAFAVLIEQYR